MPLHFCHPNTPHRKLGMPVAAHLQRAHVENIIAGKKKTPEAGNNLLKILRLVLNHRVAVGMIASNPALGVQGFKKRNPDGHHTWSEAEIAQFQAAHPINTRAGLAVALALHTGQRPGDVLRMGWQHIKGDKITVKQQKTGKTLVASDRT
jgi:integrase